LQKPEVICTRLLKPRRQLLETLRRVTFGPTIYNHSVKNKFFNHVPRGYMCQWDLDKLGSSLEERKFQNCDEEIIFNAVVVYCRSKSNATESFEQLAPGLQKSCANYLRFLQSVPRTLPLPFNKLPR
jgi:hypothetical protein